MCFDDNKQANVCVIKFAKCAGIYIGPRELVLKVINGLAHSSEVSCMSNGPS